jgi:hypothetical protein
MADAAGPSSPHHRAADAAHPAAPPLTLDECRDAFYVAQRACERHTEQLKAFVGLIDSKKAQADEAWIEAVQEEAKKALFFHSNQHAEWDAFSERADTYVDSVRRLAEAMAMAGAARRAGPVGFGGRLVSVVGWSVGCRCGACSIRELRP